MTKKEKVLAGISPEQKQALVNHFNSIYDCNELTGHEEKMIYLAWMWKQGIVQRNADNMPGFDEAEAGVPMDDYEVTIEDEITGGVNLELMYEFYDLQGIQKIMKW